MPSCGEWRVSSRRSPTAGPPRGGPRSCAIRHAGCGGRPLTAVLRRPRAPGSGRVGAPRSRRDAAARGGGVPVNTTSRMSAGPEQARAREHVGRIGARSQATGCAGASWIVTSARRRAPDRRCVYASRSPPRRLGAGGGSARPTRAAFAEDALRGGLRDRPDRRAAGSFRGVIGAGECHPHAGASRRPRIRDAGAGNP